MSLKVLAVALHGPAFSGKDTAMRLLGSRADQNGVRVREVRFAAPIYRMLQALLPDAHTHMTKAEKEAPRKEFGGLSVRQMAVAVGEGARKYDDHSWVVIAADQVREAIAAAETLGLWKRLLIVVPDLRKEAELAMLLSLPAEGVEVVIVHIDPLHAPVNGQPDQATETPLPLTERSVVVRNDHSLGVEAFDAELASALKAFDGELFSQFFTGEVRHG